MSMIAEPEVVPEIRLTDDSEEPFSVRINAVHVDGREHPIDPPVWLAVGDTIELHGPKPGMLVRVERVT